MHTSFVRNTAYISHRHSDGTSSKSAVELKPKGAAMLLQHGDYLRLHRAEGWTVTALSGTVWITQDHDIRDIVLVTGKSFTLDRKGLAMLSAFDQARICITRDGASCAEQNNAGAPAGIRHTVRPAFA